MQLPVPEAGGYGGDSMKKRLEVLFTGRVQGVGFRYTTQQVAAGYEVRGTVRNLADGRVELLAEGEEKELQDFVTGIEESQLGGFITEKQLKWGEPQNNLKGFKIVS
jgi:acylphosphatase